MNEEILIILDSDKYRARESQIKAAIQDICAPAFFYTDYENRLIRFLHRIKGPGNMLSHIAYWTVSLWDAVRIYATEKQPHKLFVNPIVGFFYCLLLSVFRGHDKVVVAGFLFEDKSSSLYLNLRKQLVSFAYSKVSRLIVYSSIEEKKYNMMFPTLAGKIMFVKYGRDFDIFEESKYKSNSPYVASGGGSNRDFKTFIASMTLLEQKDPPILSKIATRPGNISSESIPKNVEILYDIRLDRFGAFLDNSLFVVLPLKNNDISAGHMVLMESMRLGKVIIITDIPSVRDYVDESQVYFYKPGDSQGLAEMITNVYENMDAMEVQSKAASAKQLYDIKYTFCSFLKRLTQATLLNDIRS